MVFSAALGRVRLIGLLGYGSQPTAAVSTHDVPPEPWAGRAQRWRSACALLETCNCALIGLDGFAIIDLLEGA